jgi:hypothetical protein
MRILRILSVTLLAAVLSACHSGEAEASTEKPQIPEVPEVAAADLRQELHTLRAMVVEHERIYGSDESSDTKASLRLALLRQGFDELQGKCLEKLDPATPDASSVRRFLDACSSVIQKN